MAWRGRIATTGAPHAVPHTESHTGPEATRGPSGEGMVVLDIGGDTGALVVHTLG